MFICRISILSTYRRVKDLTCLCYNYGQMKADNYAGFTIIETMLFLGITGLLIMGVLVGAGTSINIQRYHDSVTSLQSILQRQFSDVANVSNDSAGDLPCSTHGIKARGQSDCVLLGKYITTTDSHTLNIKSVIGYVPDDTSFTGLDDVAALQLSAIQISPVSGETYDIEWGSSIVHAGGNVPMQFSMLTLRSPISGVVRTFIDPNVSTVDVAKLITPAALTQSVKVCVDSNGLFTGGKSAVLVMGHAETINGVTIITRTDGADGIETLGEVMSGC